MVLLDARMRPKQPASLCPTKRGVHYTHKSLKQASNADRLFRFITQLTVLAIWKSLTTLSAPVGRLFAFYCWAGRATFKLTCWLQGLLLKVLGWLASPAFARTHWLRQWGKHYMPLDVKKWHVVVGKLDSPPLPPVCVARSCPAVFRFTCVHHSHYVLLG